MKRITLALVALCMAQPAFAQSTTGIYKATPPTLTDGVQQQVLLDANGNLKVSNSATGTSSTNVQGTSASGVADDGSNPVKVGGVYVASPAFSTDGFRQRLVTNGYGYLVVQPTGALSAPIDSGTNILYGTFPNNQGNIGANAVAPHVWNGTNMIVQRGDTSGTWVNIAPSATATVGTALNVTSAVASSLVAKASAGNLYGVNVTAGASAGFILIFNATSAPADGAVTPARCIPLAANASTELNYRTVPLAFTTGITVVFSTTGCFSKTASATAFIAADAK